jgi:hypothetical protein
MGMRQRTTPLLGRVKSFHVLGPPPLDGKSPWFPVPWYDVGANKVLVQRGPKIGLELRGTIGVGGLNSFKGIVRPLLFFRRSPHRMFGKDNKVIYHSHRSFALRWSPSYIYC